VAGIQVCLKTNYAAESTIKNPKKLLHFYSKVKQPPRFKLPWLSILSTILFAGVIGGYDKMRFDKPNDQTGFVRMLQPLEERAKKMGEKAAQPSYRVVMRFFGSAPTMYQRRKTSPTT
jgi:hypothetical protein